MPVCGCNRDESHLPKKQSRLPYADRRCYAMLCDAAKDDILQFQRFGFKLLNIRLWTCEVVKLREVTATLPRKLRLVWSFKTLLHNQLCTTNPDTSMLLSSTQETHRATEKQKHQELSPCYMKTDHSTYAISHVWQGRTPFQRVSTMFNKGLYNSKYVNRVLKLTAAMYSGRCKRGKTTGPLVYSKRSWCVK